MIEEKREQEYDEEMYDAKKYDLYHDGKFKLPTFIKIALLKIWAAGAVCYFVHIGTFDIAPLDLLVIDSFIMCLVIEYIINNIILWMDNDANPTKHYAFIEKRSFLSLFVNLLYASINMLLVFLSFIGIGILVDRLGIDIISDVSFGTSPLIFGLLFFFFDLIFISIKNVIKKYMQQRV